ncbi:MAG: hypothetical protein ACLRRT_15360 [Ruthenibacterium lactatiformans]
MPGTPASLQRTGTPSASLSRPAPPAPAHRLKPPRFLPDRSALPWSLLSCIVLFIIPQTAKKSDAFLSFQTHFSVKNLLFLFCAVFRQKYRIKKHNTVSQFTSGCGRRFIFFVLFASLVRLFDCGHPAYNKCNAVRACASKTPERRNHHEKIGFIGYGLRSETMI